jgi:hypothetical protein
VEFVSRWCTGQAVLLTAVLGNRLVVSVVLTSLRVVFGSITSSGFVFALVFQCIPSQINNKISNILDNSLFFVFVPCIIMQIKTLYYPTDAQIYYL